MRTFSFSKPKSKPGNEHADDESITSSRSKSSIKKLPSKVAKKVKRQFVRLDEMLHHVTHTKHPERPRTLSAPTSPPPPALNVVHAYFPPAAPPLFHSKFHTEPDIRSIDRSSGSCSVISTAASTSEAHPAVPPSSADFGLSLSPIMDDEQSRTASVTGEEAPLSSEPMFTSPPTVYVEPEAPDPFLVDEEGDALSDEDHDKQDSSVPMSQDTSPAHNVPLDLPPTPSPQPTAQQPLPPVSPLPNINKDVPPPPSSDSDLDEEEVPDIYVPQLIVPTMFLPIPNVRRSLSSDYLTWYLRRNSLNNVQHM